MSPENQPFVSMLDVRKSFTEGSSERMVLSDLNAEFAPDTFHAIVGRSGSGKSTILNLIAGIDLPDSGVIRVGNCAINEISETERTLLRRRSIGFIFQFFNLIPSLTVEENVQLPIQLLGMDDQDIRVTSMLRHVDLEDRRKSYPEVLSGGEQQRVAIARALVHEPELILADEPTGNLDDDTASHVLRVLLNASGRRTIILVTHSRETASQADRVWNLRSGSFDNPQSEK